ncbi:MAG: hypothetical protein M1541_10885 [Acidobacteria bacterium]|nr:hypothetical protein [Acidobacteriota bacterium]
MMALAGATVEAAPGISGPLDLAAWLLGAGWLALAFGLGMSYQRIRSLDSWMESISSRVRRIESHGSPSVAVLAERVDSLHQGLNDIKEGLAEIQKAVIRARGVGA